MSALPPPPPSRARPVALFVAVLTALAVMTSLASAQQRDTTKADSASRAARLPRDTGGVQGSIYSRPFIGALGQTAIGGYAEGNSNHFTQDGISDGFSMEMRRFNIFLFSSVGQRLRFIAELEFEKGTEEIAIEAALLDFRIDPAFVLRAGILLPPLGAFNQNHDSPRWEFVDRPLVSTRIIPATLAEIGFGALGRIPLRGLPGVTVTYDAYLTNGLGDGVILNAEGRTLLAAGKRPEQFAEDNNGSPAFSGRLAVQRGRNGEVGLSHYGAIYNTFRVDGADVDDRRRLSITALDAAVAVGPMTLRGEAAMTRVAVPASLIEVFGSRQHGAHVDAVVPIWKPRVAGIRGAVVNAALRLEYIDYNVGTFESTGDPIRDDVRAIVPGLSFRPSASTVFKANYRREWHRDLLGNPTVRRAGWQVGFATYF